MLVGGGGEGKGNCRWNGWWFSNIVYYCEINLKKRKRDMLDFRVVWCNFKIFYFLYNVR